MKLIKAGDEFTAAWIPDTRTVALTGVAATDYWQLTEDGGMFDPPESERVKLAGGGWIHKAHSKALKPCITFPKKSGGQNGNRRNDPGNPKPKPR